MQTIYMYINKINNKKYIGQTKQFPPEKRWKNGKGYRNCTYLDNAIKKYGWENFEHIILEQFEDDQEYANTQEKYYIQKYETNNIQKGYNITEGGTDSISENALPAALKWMQEHPDFGKARAQDMLKWQQEHPQEAYEMRLKNIKKATEARKRKVRCIETGIVYESASEAARQVPGTNQSKICMVCRGQRNICGGFHWEYVIEED